MTVSCENREVLGHTRGCDEREAEKCGPGSWVDEPWSTWLPAMIKAEYWEYYETNDLNSALLTNGYSKRYFCTSCPKKGSLLPHQVVAGHASHVTIGVSRQRNFTGVLYDELKCFLDVSNIKQECGSDGRSYLQLRSLIRSHRRVKSRDEITCSDCKIIKSVDGGFIMTTFCSVECQFSSKLSRDAAILFALMVPEETRVRKFHHYLDYNLIKLSDDSSVPKCPQIARMDTDDDHAVTGLPHLVRNPDRLLEFPLIASPTLSTCVTTIRDMQTA